MYKIDKQQGPALWNRELYLVIACDGKESEKEYWIALLYPRN